MNLILYANGKCKAGKRLRKAIEEMFPEQCPEILSTIKSLTGRICQPESNGAIAVLLAANRKELLDLLSIRDLLFDVRKILILPDRGMETISKGHSLYPRYLTYVDSDFTDVVAVLDKMLKRII